MFQRDTRRKPYLYPVAAHAASVVEHQDHTWDDAPVTFGELAREFAAGLFILGGGIVVAWLLLA